MISSNWTNVHKKTRMDSRTMKLRTSNYTIELKSSELEFIINHTLLEVPYGAITDVTYNTNTNGKPATLNFTYKNPTDDNETMQIGETQVEDSQETRTFVKTVRSKVQKAAPVSEWGLSEEEKKAKKKAAQKKQSRIVSTVLIVGALIISGIVYGVNNKDNDDEEESTPVATFETTPPEEIAPWYGVDEDKAIQLCRWAAQAKLKNPGSANFESLLTENRPQATELNGVHMYMWNSAVTADNGFGVPLTVPFSCIVYPMPNGGSKANVTLSN